MRILVCLLALATYLNAHAEKMLAMNFTNGELVKMIEHYAKATGEKFILDPGVRGKATILGSGPVSATEAYSQLSTALALNGYAISKQGDTFIVKAARNIQRDLVEVSTERPSLKPERMYTWVYSVRNISADEVNRNMRILASRDGEIVPIEGTNQLIITDWTSNLNRIAEILKEVDKKPDPSVAKIIEQSRAQNEKREFQECSRRHAKGVGKDEN